jgi:xanthine dehydrogenase small subunit
LKLSRSCGGSRRTPTRSRSAARSPRCPRAAHRLAADSQPRNVAGNLATASPIGDTIPCLIALDATITLASGAGERVLPVESFITGYRKTVLAPGEVIAAIRIPLLAPGEEFAAYKVCKRFDQDISTVVAAFRLERRGGKVARLHAAYGGMAPRAMRARSLEEAVRGRPWAPAWLADVEALLARDFTPITDHRGGAAYRLRAAAGLLRRFQLEATLAEPMRVEAL